MRLIDADKLFAELQEEAKIAYKCQNYGISNGIKIAMTFVREAETVENKGKWVYEGLRDVNGNKIVYCSRCSCAEIATIKPEYCWHCGSRNEVERNETY